MSFRVVPPDCTVCGWSKRKVREAVKEIAGFITAGIATLSWMNCKGKLTWMKSKLFGWVLVPSEQLSLECDGGNVVAGKVLWRVSEQLKKLKPHSEGEFVKGPQCFCCRAACSGQSQSLPKCHEEQLQITDMLQELEKKRMTTALHNYIITAQQITFHAWDHCWVWYGGRIIAFASHEFCGKRKWKGVALPSCICKNKSRLWHPNMLGELEG